jgi:hypothetical protein
LSAPSDIPADSPFSCVYGSAAVADPAIQSKFSLMKSRLLSLRDTPAHANEFSFTKLLVCETMGHFTRRAACFESDVALREQKFEEAYSIYEGVILSLCHSSLNESVLDVRKNPKKAIIFQPFEGLDTFTADARRLISHCFAGMAICVLVGELSVVKYISLSSEAVCMEATHPLELACTLRMLPLLMCFTGAGTIITEAGKAYYMFREVSAKMLLPLMLRMGRQDLFDTELGLCEPEHRAECAEFAASIVRRIAVRLSSPAPLVTVHTYVKNGKIIERNCAACGVWDRTGKNHLRCAGCKLVYYCGKECQVAHWAAHKVDCKKK